ncbi:hypothetical protein lerEdw1_018454 [Lerista edwardsae]|nr:hypothetical protein lerEdw1_018454 [Lerista edwardsae]
MACASVMTLWKAQTFKSLWVLSSAPARHFKRYPALAAQNFEDYESIRDQYKPHVPEYFNFAKDVVDKWAEAEKEGRRQSSNPALWYLSDQGDEVKWSFEELALESKKAAAVLSEECGLQKGDRVIVILPRIPEWWLLNVACLRAAPTAYRMLVHHNLTSYKFLRLKHCVSAGEPINPEVMEQWKKETGLDIYEGYGQTETVLVCGTFKGMKVKPGSMGKPSPAYDTQDDPEKTASTLRGEFYITGDRGIRDEDGYFWFVGRADDVINSAGYRIGPFEVESALIEHPAVVESAVVSSPDPLRGEVVKAFVVLATDYISCSSEALIEELQDHVKKVTAPYKYPRKVRPELEALLKFGGGDVLKESPKPGQFQPNQGLGVCVEFVPHLPKTVSGKIRRNELRKKEWGRA